MSLPPTRPALHVMSKNWINDPNGLCWYRGRWHMFFQHNPSGGSWGNMSWGHVSSSDLVNWDEHPVALMHEADHGCFSGSAVVDEHDTAGFGAGALVAAYTMDHQPGSPWHGRQTQSIAWSSDGITFTKLGHPVLDRESQNFRDPKVSWDHERDRWAMVAVEAHENAVVHHHSANLVDWTYSGEFRFPELATPTWECPDLFPMTVGGRTRWVLVLSVNPGAIQGGSGTRWFLGDFDGEVFRAADDDPGLWLDWGSDNYAGVSFGDVPDGRRILVGWLNNWDYAHDLAEAGFPGMLTVPRQLSLVVADGAVALVQQPVDEVLASLGEMQAVEVDGQVWQAPAVGWVELDLVAPQALTIGSHVLTWADDRLVLDRAPMAGVAPAKQVSAPLRPGLDRLSLGLLVDHGCLEVYADGGRTVLTSLALDDTGPRALTWTGQVERLRASSAD
ncbi:glycoside hydrolase family 32 protein [Aestuariimicrobium ganziense]|uniref:glycoside hydrolase family 32 protein n=1 Tax=Aestuariimicrobium ganziense TaxID=2773677 RepID=UPI001941A34A|nr:glycoside hydrolase family 32 protein [Aestuariimicrobium ganziense]